MGAARALAEAIVRGGPWEQVKHACEPAEPDVLRDAAGIRPSREPSGEDAVRAIVEVRRDDEPPSLDRVQVMQQGQVAEPIEVDEFPLECWIELDPPRYVTRCDRLDLVSLSARSRS